MNTPDLDNILSQANPAPAPHGLDTEPLDPRAENELLTLMSENPGGAESAHVLPLANRRRSPKLKFALSLASAAAAVILGASFLLVPGLSTNEAVAVPAPPLEIVAPQQSKQEAVNKLLRTIAKTPDAANHDEQEYDFHTWVLDHSAPGAKGEVVYLPVAARYRKANDGKLMVTTIAGQAVDELGRAVKWDGEDIKPGTEETFPAEHRRPGATIPGDAKKLKAFVAKQQETATAMYSDNPESGLFEVLGQEMMDHNLNGAQSSATLKLLAQNASVELAGTTKDRIGRDSTAFTVTTTEQYGQPDVEQYFLLFDNATGRIGSFETKYLDGGDWPKGTTFRYVAIENAK